MLETQVAVIRRRSLLAGAIAGAGGLLVGAPAVAEDDSNYKWEWTDSTSANGWPVLSEATQVRIEGGGLQSVLLAADAPTTILTHFIRRYLYEVAGSFANGEVLGYRDSREVVTEYESNYLSGTAVEIRPVQYPLGATGGFFEPQVVVIERILSELGGVITWGRHLNPVKESHFELNAVDGSAELRRALEIITGAPTGESESMSLSMVRRGEIAEDT